MSKKQKRDVRQRWGSHLEAWLLERDDVFKQNVSQIYKRLVSGDMDKGRFRSVYNDLIQRAVRRQRAVMTDEAYNECLHDYYLKEFEDKKRYPELEAAA
jgi:hypothetical protein